MNNIIRILSKIKYISEKVNKLFEFDYLKKNEVSDITEIIDITDNNKLSYLEWILWIACSKLDLLLKYNEDKKNILGNICDYNITKNIIVRLENLEKTKNYENKNYDPFSMVKLDLNKPDNIKNMMDLFVNGFWGTNEKKKSDYKNNDIIISEHKKNMDIIVNNNINKWFIEFKVPNWLSDLIELGEWININDQDMYSFNIKKLKNLIDPLKEFDKIVGMENVKKQIINHIIYFIQDLEDNTHMMHTVLQGPPGVGKTMIAYVIGKIYQALGFLQKKENEINIVTGKKDDLIFKSVKRSDLVGKFLGHTAPKTQAAIDEASGGILFIDEAYSLGTNQENVDNFSKECIDTLTRNLIEKNDFLCIIAGYEEDLQKNFFAMNRGLERRFPIVYTINKYNHDELSKILLYKINYYNWNISWDAYEKSKKIIKNNYLKFNNYGGDIENLIFHIKNHHCKRIFSKHPKFRFMLDIEDIENAFQSFLETKKDKYDIPYGIYV